MKKKKKSKPFICSPIFMSLAGREMVGQAVRAVLGRPENLKCSLLLFSHGHHHPNTLREVKQRKFRLCIHMCCHQSYAYLMVMRLGFLPNVYQDNVTVRFWITKVSLVCTRWRRAVVMAMVATHGSLSYPVWLNVPGRWESLWEIFVLITIHDIL